MVVGVTDEGTKYRQRVVADTPEYARTGVRMEDAHVTFRTADATTVICVADGHGSCEVRPAVFVGGRECADAACAAVRRELERGGAAAA